MQYADVAVNTKTTLNRQTFTYKINPCDLPYLKPGILVSVPFHNRNLEGIVLLLKPYSPKTLKLKFINKIIDTEPIVTINQILLAKTISKYYLSPIGDILFMMIPPIAYRQVSSDLKSIDNSNNKTNHKPGEYLIYDRIDNRIETYAGMINRANKNHHGAIILFPKIDDFKIFIEKLKSYLPLDKIAVIHGNLKVSERYKIYKEIIYGKKNIVIGARSAIFSPVKNLGLIIIDQPEDFGYKEEQSPRYNAARVAKMIKNIYKTNIIFGGLFPRIEDYNELINKKNKIIKNILSSPQKNPKITLIDQNKEKNIISNSLENRISQYIESNKILIYVSKKGEGSSFACCDCGYNFTCSRCNLSLFVRHKKLECVKCNIVKEVPSTCPHCNSAKLKSFGIGSEKLKNELAELYPNATINIIEDDKSITEMIYSKSDIIIATKKIFNSNYKFHLSAIINIDGQLNSPDYRSSENVLFDFAHLKELTNYELLIQTFNFDNFIISNLNRPKSILNKILSERIKYNYPPFSKIIKLIYKDSNDHKCLLENNKMTKTLINTLKDKANIIGSGPCFINKKRDKYCYQIITKFFPKHERIVKKNLLLIKGISKWIIDIDPIDLL